MITGIKRVSIDVSDMSTALHFFIEQLDLPVLREIGSREYAHRWEMGVGRAGTTVGIVQPKPGERPAVPGQVIVVFETDDIAADYQALQARGVVFMTPPTVEPFDGKVAYFKGPDGVLLSLVEPNREQ